MADWVRSPKHFWWTNDKWQRYAFESARNNTENLQWNSYFGSFTRPILGTSKGLNPSNPFYRSTVATSRCNACEVLQNCGSSARVFDHICRQATQYACGLGNCNQSSQAYCLCLDPNTCAGADGGGYSQENCQDNFLDCAPDFPCGYCPPPCEGNNCQQCIELCANDPLPCQDGTPLVRQGLNRRGEFVPLEDGDGNPNPDVICNPCTGGCDDFRPCACGGSAPGGGSNCFIIGPGETCPSGCCFPNEPGCAPCCTDDVPEGECDTWAPIGSCGDDEDCMPFGYPMDSSYCEGCDFCNFNPDAEQCKTPECCKCPNGTYVACGSDEYDACDPEPPICTDFTSNCYACSGQLIPIWFECSEEPPCPNPFNPDCERGGNIVCYDYNTNDPIYYNASNLGATVIVEHDSPVAGNSYSYGRVATLCEVPDSLQLCVFGVTSGGAETKLTFGTDYTVDETLATITLDSSLNVSSFTKIKFSRCTDDQKMFLTFTEGAKLSATDVNASLHQLLFLIQEKEFASNNYVQVQNAASTKASLTFVLDSTKVAATATDVINTTGLNAEYADDSLTFALPASAGGQGTTTILFDKDQSTSPAATANTIAIGVRGAAATTTLTVTDGDAPVTCQERDIITLTSTDGTTKKYVIVDDISTNVTTGTILTDTAPNNDVGSVDLVAGNPEVGGIAVRVNIASSTSTQNFLLTQLKAAIEHPNGHNGKIIVSAVPGQADGNQSITLTQAVAGPAGNRNVIQGSVGGTNIDDLASQAFTGGGLTDTAIRDVLVKAINGVSDSTIAFATSGNGQAGVQGITASNGSTSTKITLTSSSTGAATNSADIVVDVAGGVAMVNAASKDFTGGKDFTPSEFDTFSFQLKANTASTVVDKTYLFDTGGSLGATGSLSSGKVVIQLNGKDSAADLTAEIEKAIINTGHTNGHGTNLTTTRTTNTLTLDRIVIQQALAGASGNFTSLVHSAELNTRLNQGVAVWDFQFGQDNDPNNPIITFDPPVSLPVNFDLTSVRQDSLLAWDGDGGFIGNTASQVLGNATIDNLSNVNLNTTSTGDVLYYSGNNWVNSNLTSLVNSIVNVFDLTDFTSYNVSANGKLDDYYYELGGCETTLDTAWDGSDSCITNIPKNLIPNAFTSFGLGYFGAKKSILDDLSDPTSAISVAIDNKIGVDAGTPGEIHSSFRWDIGRGEGRGLDKSPINITDVPSYPRAFFDVRDFDYISGTVDTSSTVDRGDYTGYPVAPHGTGDLSSTSVDVSKVNPAYYRSYVLTGGGQINPAPKNKLWEENISKFVYDGLKSRASGFRVMPNGTDFEDRYFDLLKSVVNKKDWGTALGYTESHPLTDLPTASNDYPTAVDNLIRRSYTFTTSSASAAEGTGGQENYYYSTRNLPAVMTYYLANLWDGTSIDTGTDASAPSIIEWTGNLHNIGDLDNLTETTQKTYLGATGNYWFYYKWFVTASDANGGGGSTSDESVYDQAITYYSPLDKNKVSLNSDNDFTVYPAEGDTTPNDEDHQMARGGGYSFLMHANSVFTDISQYLPDVFDEYVFSVTFGTPAAQVGVNCSDARCYEVVAKVEKYIDGCGDGENNCSKLGNYNTAGNDQDGYFVYPQDFNDNVVKVWDSYPYEKLSVEVRNKTGLGFDLVLKVPRMKRVGKIQVYSDTDSGTTDYRQLTLDWLANYNSENWDNTSALAPEDVAGTPPSNANTGEAPPALRDMVVKSPAAFDIETAVQFIRLGIPASVRVSFFTLNTPQTSVFSD